MAITRTPIIDDDGTGTTGTVIDNAWKTELYNQIDAADGAIGTPWQATPYVAAAYFSAGGMTWTVEAADVAANWYRKAGRVLSWGVNIATSTTGGTGAAYLYIAIPEGLVPAFPIRRIGKHYSAPTGWMDVDVQTTTQAGAPVVSISRLDLAAIAIVTNALYVHFQIDIPY
jgi:hypothetical protein